MRAQECKAEDFVIGQLVVCIDPEGFVAEKCRYLTGRQGVVEKVWPSTGDRQTAMRINEVSVRWLKKNNRGKEQIMIMRPRHLRAVAEEK